MGDGGDGEKGCVREVGEEKEKKMGRERGGGRAERGGRRRSWDGHGRLAGFWKEGRHVGTGSRGSWD
jgi:hypothetical protein